MAKYDSDFLGRYMQNVCSLHLAKEELQGKISILKRDIWALKDEECPQMPDSPELINQPILSWIFMIICVVASMPFIGGAVFVVFQGIIGMTIGLGVPLGIVAVIFLCVAANQYEKIKCVFDSNREMMEQYEDICRSLPRRIAEWEGRQALVPPMEQECSQLLDDYLEADRLLNMVYSANVIPFHYRNTYAAMYLYEYFSNSQEDDITIALNTFVLEQVKEKLDKVIKNQARIILNQRVFLANQEKSLEQQREHYAKMEAKIDRMKAGEEERKQYLKMIESNTAVTAYFSTANWLNS